ncbi:MAG: glycoside hydrolase family 105 protein [Salinivirgaceae bacterium]
MKPLLYFLLLLCLAIKTTVQSQEPIRDNSPEAIGRLLINDLLNRQDFMMYQSGETFGIHYAEACSGFGAVRLAALLNDSVLLQKLAQRYRFSRTDSIPNSANHVDVSVYGILPLELYRQGLGTHFLDQGLQLADKQWEQPKADGLPQQARFWIDDIWMIASLQVQAYRVTSDSLYLMRTARLVDVYIKKLQQSNGLFYHGFDGPFFWGRGNGWVAAGLAELLSELPNSNPNYTRLVDAYKKMMKTLLHNQAEDGMWRQLIDNETSFKETSSTAMFGYAMALGVKKELLPEDPYRKAIDKAWQALATYVTPDGKLREVCVGTGQSTDTSFYLMRPRITGDLHGQAPLLWFAYSRLAE